MTAGPPPPRPSTARLSAPPVAARRDRPRPPAVSVSCWLWWLAAGLAFLAVLFTATRLDAVRDVLARAARDSDPAATADRIDRVVDLSMSVIIGGGLLLGIGGGLLALGLRAGRGWARVTLFAFTVLAVAYGLLVVSATGWLVLAYSAAAVAATVCMCLPAARRWFA